MKYTLILIFGLLFSSMGVAQDLLVQDVPAVVLNSFNQAFPKASDVEWEMKGENYNVEFDIGRRDHEVWLDSKGTIIKHKEELRARDLPADIAKRIKENNAGYRIDDVDKIVEGNQTYYKVELENANIDKTIVVDQNGALTDKRF